jgi:hypothetical protein
MEDLSKLSKKDLIDLVEKLATKQAELTSEPAAPVEVAAPATTQIDVNALMAALVAARQPAPVVSEDNKTYKCVNASGMALGIEVADGRTGLIRTYSLPKTGDFCMLTGSQVEELQEKAPHFFENGYVSVPDLIADNPNVIRHMAKFIAELAFDDIETRIDAITSKDTLFTLFNHIENQRFIHEDAHGKALTDKIGGEDSLVLKEVKLSPKLATIERAVKSRLEEVSGIRINLDGK